jgi:hypothetical protein
MPSPRVVHTAAQAIDALGGANYVADLLGFGANAVRNWYRRGFPPEAYALLAPRLREAGCDFSDELFRQYPVATAPRRPPKPKPKPRRRKNGGR